MERKIITETNAALLSYEFPPALYTGCSIPLRSKCTALAAGC